MKLKWLLVALVVIAVGATIFVTASGNRGTITSLRHDVTQLDMEGCKVVVKLRNSYEKVVTESSFCYSAKVGDKVSVNGNQIRRW